jgi:HlyD family secretion protein
MPAAVSQALPFSRLSIGRIEMSTHMRLGMLVALGLVHIAFPVQAGDEKQELPVVQVIKPPVRTIARVIGQPASIESFERTAIFPKLTAYIREWKADIGDKVKKDQPLASLFVPELVEDYGTKKATVELDKERVKRNLMAASVAEGDVAAAQARVKEATAVLAKEQAEVARWDSEVTRLNRAVARDGARADDLRVARNQLKASTAAREEAKATVAEAEADVLTKQAALAKAHIDVAVARAFLRVAESEERRLKAWLGYLTIGAPFDGVISARNANTFDLVQSAPGTPPIYVVDRTDIVRVFVDIPERDAKYVFVGAKASVLAPAYRELPIPGVVARTSWALNVKTRALRAEIDLPNPNGQLLPGMYAYVRVIIEHPSVRALPQGAIIHSGERSSCWMYENGRAVRNEIETGISDGKWVEVINRRLPVSDAAPTADAPWRPINGSEQMITADVSTLTEGAAVQVVPAGSEPEVTSTAASARSTRSSAPEQGRQERHLTPPSALEQPGDRARVDAIAALDAARIELALEEVKVAEADVQAAETRNEETRLILAKHQSEVERWQSELTRVKRQVAHCVMDSQILPDTEKVLKAHHAARDAAKAAIETAKAELRFKKAKLAAAKVEVKVAKAALAAERIQTDHLPHSGQAVFSTLP